MKRLICVAVLCCFVGSLGCGGAGATSAPSPQGETIQPKNPKDNQPKGLAPKAEPI